MSPSPSLASLATNGNNSFQWSLNNGYAREVSEGELDMIMNTRKRSSQPLNDIFIVHLKQRLFRNAIERDSPYEIFERIINLVNDFNSEVATSIEQEQDFYDLDVQRIDIYNDKAAAIFN